jgi:hypothetical protein
MANDQDAKKPAKRGKMPSSPIKAPQGNVKGIGPLGQYNGGLSPSVVKPVPGLSPRRVAPTIFRIGAIDGSRKRSK